MAASVLIVDDEPGLARQLDRLLRAEGYQLGMAHSGHEARRQMARLFPDVVLMDLRLPDADGGELMTELKQEYPDAEFIIITAHGSIRSAVESTRRGAVDYLAKPFEPEELLAAVEHAVRSRNLEEEVRRLRSKPASVEATPAERGAVRSAAMREVMALAERVAGQDGTALLLGESGTGKDVMARWIHRHSARAEAPYFVINCAALAPELAESELFGHEPGAFTGSRGRKRGLLELAEHGTLLLNEIGELAPGLQAKLLSFLDSKSFMRVGGESAIRVDTRLIAATNRDLERMVGEGRFRQDLYYRLAVLPIHLPPLRDRIEDLPLLAAALLRELGAEMGLQQEVELSAEALKALERHDWPGNIRQLRNALERALMLTSGAVIGREALELAPRDGDWRLVVAFPQDKALPEVTREVARELIREALQRAPTKQEAAVLLGISRFSLARQIKALGLDV
jgi:DNA-binding NtrC family response regulator